MKNSSRNKRILILLLAMIVAFSPSCPAFGMTAAETVSQNEMDSEALNQDSVPLQITITDDQEETALPEGAGDDLHLRPLVVDTESGQVETEDGQTLGLEEAFDISRQEAEKIRTVDGEEGARKLQECLQRRETVAVTRTGEEEVTVGFPFAYKRIFLYEDPDAITSDYGAENILYYTEDGCYILDFSSEEAAAGAFDRLAEDFGTDKVMPDLPVSAEAGSRFDVTSALSLSWGTDMMQLDKVRDLANSTPSLKTSITVAVLDSGINTSHVMFQGRLTDYGASYVSGRAYSRDMIGHGTHVAGIIADGTPDQVKIIPVKVLDDRGAGSISNMIKGVNYAVSKKADVINMSFGTDLSVYGKYWTAAAYKNMEAALKKAWSNGCVCIAAVGNTGSNIDKKKTYPAISGYTIGVGSISQARRWANFSNYGSAVDFIAPGIGILSAFKGGRKAYAYSSGTSMAAPHVSAVAAVLSLYNKKASNKKILALMKALSYDYGAAGKDKYYGNGLIVFYRSKVPKVSDLSAVSICPGKASMASEAVFRSKGCRPPITLTLDGLTLRKGTAYSVTWKKNKKVGIATAVIKGKGFYRGTITRTFRIIPPKTKIKTIRKLHKKIRVTWKKKKTKQVGGYQIAISTDKTFKGWVRTVRSGAGEKSRIIKGLKTKTTYYVRIRTYKRVGSKTYYSHWSKVKVVRGLP